MDQELAARRLIGAGAIAGFLAVVVGAFAAHGLEKVLTPKLLSVVETGARYQMYHAFALVLTGLACGRVDVNTCRRAGACFGAGILLFSGSLYVLAATNTPALGAITPFGGLAFLAGWGILAWGCYKRK